MILTLSTLIPEPLVTDKHSTPGRRHPPGNLRTVLIRETADILGEEGLSGVTLRALSHRPGVSRTAPYPHFNDKTELLCVVAESGFQDFGSRLAAASPAGPLAKGPRSTS